MYFLTETMQTGDAGQVAKQAPQAHLGPDDRKLGGDGSGSVLGGSAWEGREIPFLTDVSYTQ